MKTPEEIQAARKIVRDRFSFEELAWPQKILLCGMLQALIWACDGTEDSTMRDVLAGRAINASPDPASFLTLVLRKQAEDYLRRIGMAGSPLRTATTEEADA